MQLASRFASKSGRINPAKSELPYLDVNLLLNIDIVRHLIVLALAETILFQILPRKNMMDITPVFDHLFHTDVSRQESFDLLLECQLCISLLFE